MPENLRRLSSTLLETQPPSNAGCVWIAAVEPDYGKAYPQWREAWQLAFARLNSHRNEIRRHFSLPLVFVGAPWLQEVMREIAPDLWSVRTLVVRIEPLPQSGATKLTAEPAKFDFEHERTGADPVFALKEAEKLRGLPGKELALARLLIRAGEGFASRHDWPSARKSYVEALELNQHAGAAPDLLLANLKQLAIACAITGRYRDSISYLETALNTAREIGDRSGEGNVLGILGNAYADLGQPRKAIEFYEQALVIFRAISDRRGEGSALCNLGNAYADLGQPRKAIEFYEQALVIFRAISDRRGEGGALGNLGTAYAELGQPLKAISFYEQQLVITREIGDRRGEGNALGNLGGAHYSLGEPRKTISFYDQALVIAREIGNRRGEGNALFNSAVALNELNDRTQAIARAEAALKIYEAIESPRAAKAGTQLAAWRRQVK